MLAAFMACEQWSSHEGSNSMQQEQSCQDLQVSPVIAVLIRQAKRQCMPASCLAGVVESSRNNAAMTFQLAEPAVSGKARIAELHAWQLPWQCS